MRESWRVVSGVVVLALAGLLSACGDGGAPGGAEAGVPPPPGEQTYRRFCFSCHASGAAGAPRVGDVAAWAPRVERGMDTLMRHTIEGMPGMPARGMCTRCDDDELRDVVNYMIERSGARPFERRSGSAAAGG